MVCLQASARLILQQAGIVRLTDARGSTIRVLKGAVWITQHNDGRDIVLEAGSAFTLDRDGLAIVYGIVSPAEIAIEDPATPPAVADEPAPAALDIRAA